MSLACGAYPTGLCESAQGNIIATAGTNGDTVGGLVYAVDGRTGAVQWSSQRATSVLNLPVCGPSGDVYIAVLNGVEFSVGAYSGDNGTQLWLNQGDGGLFYALSETGMLVTNGGGDYVMGFPYLSAFFAGTGTTLWNITIGEGGTCSDADDGSAELTSPIAIGGDGTIYAGNKDTVVAVDPTHGSLLWSASVTGCLATRPVIAGPGMLVVGSADGMLHAFT